MIKSIDVKTGNVAAVVLAVIIGGFGLWYQNYMYEQKRQDRVEEYRKDRIERDAKPASDWFEVTNLVIPDFEVGANPSIIYDRVIKEDFSGVWKIDLVRIIDNSIACYNGEPREYTKDRLLPSSGINMSWFFGVDKWDACSNSLEPGQYVLIPTWDINAPGYPDKKYTYSVNSFRVLPKGAKPYVTEKQTEQLMKAEELLKYPIPLLKGLSQ